jgi:hypothetical protein
MMPTQREEEIATTKPNEHQYEEEHLDAAEDDGSAEIQPEDGGKAESSPDKPDAAETP